MTNEIIAAGFVVIDDLLDWSSTDDKAILATGATFKAARTAFLAYMQDAEITLLSDKADSSEAQGSWARASNFQTRPATAALLAAFEQFGGNIGFTEVGGVCCTSEEDGFEEDND